MVLSREKYLNLTVFLLFFTLIFSPTAIAAPISAVTNKIIYATGDSLTITGTISTTGAQTLTAAIYNSTSSIMNVSSATSSGASPNTFSIANSINASYSPGNYLISLTDGTDSVNMSIRIVSQLISLETQFINNLNDVINVSTNTVVNNSNLNYLNGNFTDLINLSISKQLYYGNYSVEGKTYHFVLVDQTNTSSYDRLYIDDDADFRLFNDTEDSTTDIEYQALRKGSLFSNGTFRYIVGELERTTGNKIILFKPAVGKPPYSTTDTVNFVVIAKNSTRLLSNQIIAVNILNPAGQNVTPTTTHTTNDFGWFNASKNLTAVSAGFYALNLNESLEIIPFPVEAFKLFVSIADTSNKPTSSFAPNSQVRIMITSRNATSPINLSSFSVTIYYPNATTSSKANNDFTQVSDGIYRYDLSLTGAPTGRYGISITGSDGTNTQTTSAGFEIQSVNFEAMAINTRYLEEAESKGAMMNAFPPNSNITIMTFLSNISAGGIMAKGPEGFTGLITPSNCNSSVTVIEVKDENDISYSVNYQAMNLSDAIPYLGQILPPDIPQQFLSQCMVIFETPNRTGLYRTEIKINYQGEEKYTGVTFGIQRLWAYGSTVDFKGDDFSFFAPNSTVRIKLKVRDLSTDQELSANNITNAKIIELYKVYPSFKDVLGNSTLRNNLNESIFNGTISFTSPVDEGFYMMKFRFTANLAGTSESGIGDAFFMLKKYMIWGQLAGAQTGQWYVKQGQNITLTVTVLDIDKAQSLFGGYSNQKTCTGCGGFVINVSEVRNDQQFKTVTGYTVQTGTISNSTNPVANVTIIPSAGTDMQSGWYSVDLIVNDTSTGSTYFGWGWFETRNFWVDVQKVEWNGTHYRMVPREGPTIASYAVGQPIYFTVLPREPVTGQILSPSSVSVDSVQWFVGWPPVPISGYSASTTQRDILICYGSACSSSTGYVATISNLPTDKRGEFQANVKVTVGSTSDTGSFAFSISTYQLETSYRINSWPPLFATTENFTVNFTATDFQNNPHNITNATIDDFFDMKRGRPIKMRYGGLGVGNYTASCNLINFCKIDVNISQLLSGEYYVRFTIVDNQNVQKSAEAMFKVQAVVVSIPSIGEAWVWETDDVSKKVEEDVRRGQWSQCANLRSSISNATFFCSDYQPVCPGGCTIANFNLTAPNVSYTKEVFGYIPLMEGWAIGRFGSVANKSKMCMYANGSHMWINSTFTGNCDLRNTTSIAINGNFTDSKGGQWRLDAIGDQSITITGLNTLYKTGILINTSYSRSGIIKIGQIQENQVGAFTPQGRTGIDLSGNSFSNDTVYFAIADNTTAGVYDNFFFSTNGNFTGNASPTIVNPISVNDANRANREFGNSTDSAKRLTLLSMDTRAQGLKFYSRQAGDWAHLGEVKLGNNIRIPVIVASPDGTAQTKIVNITQYKNMRNWVTTTLSPQPNASINGIGELTINSSTVGTGEFAFALAADETMEEWKWPMATVRGYLVDGDLGEALYVTNPQTLELRDYRWDSPGVQITRIQQDRRNTSSIADGVLAHSGPFDFGPGGENCKIYQGGSDITGQVNWNSTPILKEYSSDQTNYYFYTNTTDGGIRYLYKNATGCNFNISAVTGGLQEGNYTTIVKYGKTYNVSILKIDVYQYGGCNPLDCWRADFGIAGINSSILPMVNRTGDIQWGVEWGYMQNVSIFGTYYDVVLANGTYNYQRCVLEPASDGQCAKKSWLVQTSIGNFSHSSVQGLTPGQNFTSDLYLASVGPNDGDGITVGNFTAINSTFSLPQLPKIAGINMEFPNITRFNVLNESVLNSDLDMDGGKNRTYYMLLFDADFNSQQNLSSTIIDDDREIVTWSSGQTQLDLTGNETFNGAGFDGINRTNERWNELPSGIRNGNVCFGQDYNVTGRQWEFQPCWDMPFYNTSHMILKKPRWITNSNQNVSMVLKVYNFDQTALSGANVSITQMARALPWVGFQVFPAANYSVDKTYNRTDSYGYSMLKITPNPTTTQTWPDGNYQVIADIQSPQGNETFERWFCVGSCTW